MILEAIATVVLGGLCFWGGIKAGRFWSDCANLGNGDRAIPSENVFQGKNAVSLLFLGLYILLIVVMLNIPQSKIFPQNWRIYGLQTSWTLIRISFLGFCGVAYAITQRSARPQIWSVVLLSVLGIGGFSAAESYILAPIYGDLIDNLQPNGVFKQTSMTSCAPSALATVLRRWNIQDATEVSVAKYAKTSRLGTTMPQIIDAARTFGLDGIELSPTWEQMQTINRPGVLAVWLIDGTRKLPHAVALLGMDKTRAAIADPSSGKIFLFTRSEFAEVWRQQYVPIYRPPEVLLLRESQAMDYLKQLGYNSSNLKAMLKEFQRSHNITATGTLDTQTTLLLTGAFLNDAPTLKDLQLPLE
ncbi:cysteine peptidase family C39 domain-containing protein [Myxacorys almedinensis]|uniref:Peptidase C39 domain-containing protein n=1 Tax=Myxacorys almedinensis A TaxID=2690445 RepID=A0A8J8CKB5_9CYAN|nr:cysteine peptidase family C39 domain-containing protein [Myxacorys almedinensis]NDJ19698.1 hypothetical protein [Myxacorys almedinensis A]